MERSDPSPPSPDSQPHPTHSAIRPASARAGRVVTQIIVALVVVSWTGLVIVATLVIGYLWGYGECPNVGPGVYWGSPEPECAAGYYRRTIGVGALAWVTPFVVVLLARAAVRQSKQGTDASSRSVRS